MQSYVSDDVSAATPTPRGTLDRRRVAIFLAFSYGLAWTVGLIVALTGGLVNSPQLVPGIPITLALVLLATGYMWAPALAHLLTRVITGEGWRELRLRPRLRASWRYWVIAWLVPGLVTILGAALFFVVFPSHFDPSLGVITTMLAQATTATGQAVPFSPWVLVAIQAGAGILLGPFVNSVVTFGEEWGWRGYLLPKLLPLGERKALLVSGVIWGVWHWPVIAMGHNYGFGYPGAPWTGMLTMLWFTVVTGTFLGWVTLRGGSVWPAVIGHAAINGIAGLGLLFVQGRPNPLLGPMPVGLLGSIGWVLLALWIMLQRGIRVESRAATPSLFDTRT